MSGFCQFPSQMHSQYTMLPGIMNGISPFTSQMLEYHNRSHGTILRGNSPSLNDRIVSSSMVVSAHQMAGNAKGLDFCKVLVSGSKDCTVRIWDLDNGNLITVMHHHVAPVGQIILPPNKTEHPWCACFLTVGEDACVSLASLETLRAATAVIKESVEPLLEDYRPPGITSLKFSKLSIGTVAPKIEGIRVQSLKEGQITMDIDFRWGGDPSIVLAVQTALGASIPIQLKDLQVFTVVRVIFQLADEIPCISAVVAALLSEPEPRIDYTLKAVGGSLTTIPGLSDMIDVFDEDIGQDKRLGTAKLPLIELAAETMTEVNVRLLPSLDMLKIKDKKDRGTVTLKVQ
ncbi:hypothetical protein NL676_013061 [Syzygium grande]|nr:hypothetical protein NL676_013061 [Syzygium grande]